MNLKVARICEIAEIVSKGTTPTSVGLDFADSGVPFVRGEDVLGGLVSDRRVVRYISTDAHNALKRSALKSGDVVVTIAGTIGRVGYVGDDVDELNCNQAVAFIRLREAVAHPAYVCLALQSPQVKRLFEGFVAGGAIPNVNLQQIRSIAIPLPDLPRQRLLAARLRMQIAVVEQTQQIGRLQLSEIDALRQAIYRDAFASIVPVGVPPTFDAAPVGWRWTKLADIAQLESGHTPSRSRPDWWGGDISWLSLTEIRALDGRWVDETQIKTNAAGIANSSARILPRGTVCFSRTASVGFVAIMGKPMATSQDFANWVCGDQLEPEFLMHALIRARQELRAIATGATHHTIYMPALQSFHLCLPDRPTQQRVIAALKLQLAAVDRMRAAAQARLGEIEALPARLLAQAFSPTDEGTLP